MISYNKKDDNVPEIEKMNDLNSHKMKYKYRVYGLKHETGKHPVLIHLVQGTLLNQNKLKEVTDFLIRKGIAAKFEVIPNEDKKHQIYLGFRRDLRNDLKLCNNILMTVVYSVENNLDLNKPRKAKLKYS